MVKSFELNGRKVSLQVWDTAEQFIGLSENYYRGVDGALVVFDISNRSSFVEIDHWVNELEMFKTIEGNKLLIGNKSEAKRQVSFEEGRKYALMHGMSFIETSVKQRQNIHVAFDLIAKQSINSRIKERNEVADKLPIVNQIKSKPKEVINDKHMCLII